MESFELLDVFFYTSAEARQPEVTLSFVLTKARAGNRADARLVEELQSIQAIRSLAHLFCRLYLLRK